MEPIKALVTISGIRGGENGPENIQFATEGCFSRRGQAYKIEYEESDITGMSGTKTTIMANSRSVAMKRIGTVESYMSFVKGKKQHSYYNTEFGSFVVGIDPYEVDVSLSDLGGRIHVGYSVEVDHTPSGSNELDVVVKPIF